jgi:hypothetical protein
MRRSFLALVIAASIVPASTLQATSFSTLEERMSAAEFRSAGLEKLSAEELAALNAWLSNNGTSGSGSVAPPREDRRGLREAPTSQSRGPINTRLIGESTGWSYGTVFRLENGQVWRSVDRESTLVGVRLTNPSVEIRQGIMGNWRLKFGDYNTSAQVERVE